jgi:Arm domain-containing DNA-binding protein
MDKVIYNVVYNRKNRLLQNGKALIQIEAYLKGKKRYFSTKIYITPDQWDWKHRRIKNHSNQITLNKQVRDFVNELEEAELARRQSGNIFTLDYLSEFVKGSVKN